MNLWVQSQLLDNLVDVSQAPYYWTYFRLSLWSSIVKQHFQFRHSCGTNTCPRRLHFKQVAKQSDRIHPIWSNIDHYESKVVCSSNSLHTPTATTSIFHEFINIVTIYQAAMKQMNSQLPIFYQYCTPPLSQIWWKLNILIDSQMLFPTYSSNLFVRS